VKYQHGIGFPNFNCMHLYIHAHLHLYIYIYIYIKKLSVGFIRSTSDRIKPKDSI